MEQQRFSETTVGITVSVLPQPIEDDSVPSEAVYTFSYSVVIRNDSNQTVQLFERHWQIFSAGSQIGEVVGPGVVGVQPSLPPGELFEYTSSVVIHDPVGHMQGSYTFRGENGNFFEVKIPRFRLLYPMVLH